MKLIILNENETEALSGYESRKISNGTVDLGGISDNECQEILIRDCFTQVPANDGFQMLVALTEKLRKGGKLKLNGIDSRTLARHLICGKINDEQFNEFVYSCKALFSIPLLKDIIRASGLTIETLTLEGFNYDITATR